MSHHLQAALDIAPLHGGGGWKVLFSVSVLATRLIYLHWGLAIDIAHPFVCLFGLLAGIHYVADSPECHRKIGMGPNIGTSLFLLVKCVLTGMQSV